MSKGAEPVDQGLAAVIGALVGAIAAGGGAYVSARSATILNKRQARREAYRSFLREGNEISRKMQELLPRDFTARSRSNALALRAPLAELATMEHALQRSFTDVELLGTDDVAHQAVEVVLGIRFLRQSFEAWQSLPEGVRISEEEVYKAFNNLEKLQDGLMWFSGFARKQV